MEGGLEGILRSRTDERPTETGAEEEKQKEEVIDCPFRVIWNLNVRAMSDRISVRGVRLLIQYFPKPHMVPEGINEGLRCG